MEPLRLMLSAASVAWLYLRTLVSRQVYEKRNAYFHSRVFRLPSRHGVLAVKVVASDDPLPRALLFREHTFLRVLDHPCVVRYRGHLRIGSRYVLVTNWVGGPALDATTATAAAIDVHLSTLVRVLRDAGIQHRDIREKNLILSPSGPVLFDFGWAAWASERGVFTPPLLPPGDDENAAAAIAQRLAAAVSRQIA